VVQASSLLHSLAAGDGAPFEIRLVMRNSGGCPRPIRKWLKRVRNADQAYAIEPLKDKAGFHGLLLAANTAEGLLYAARTLAQLVPPPASAMERIEVPEVAVRDWPDLAERGLWGGNASSDLAWLAARKMNVVEVHANMGFESDGSPHASLSEGMLREAAKRGVKIVPIIMHLEQLAPTGLFRFHPDVAGKPDPLKPLPTEYTPSVCFSAPRTVRLLSEWMRQLLEISQVTDIMVWLSEDAAPCFCQRCSGKEPYVLEVQGVTRAFETARKNRRDASLRLLTTQGSYAVNDKVLSAAARDTKISYYDGGKTYDSSHRPMVHPMMETFAHSGRWLGVYPQLTNSWRTVFPFTGPQLIRARMREFVEKELTCLIGYATPSDRYYEFNITAAAEWSWNASGRSERQFAEAWATRKGMAHPEQWAEWAEAVGKVGWDLAGSRVVEGFIFNPGRSLSVPGPAAGSNTGDALEQMEFGKGLLAEFPTRGHFEGDVALARQELAIAGGAGDSLMVDESRCVLGALQLVSGLKDLAAATLLPAAERTRAVEAALAEVDEAAKLLTVSVYRWGTTVNPVSRDALSSRFRDSVNFASRVASAAREFCARYGASDPHPAWRLRQAGEWTTESFANAAEATLWFDVTQLADAAGEYDVTFQFVEGAAGVDTCSAALLVGRTRDQARLLTEDRWGFHVGRWDRWVEYWLRIPDGALPARDERVFLRVEMKGPPADLPPDRRTTRGRVHLRRSWRGCEP